MGEFGAGWSGQADLLEVVDELLDEELELEELDDVLLELELPDSDDELEGAAGLLLLDAARESVR